MDRFLWRAGLLALGGWGAARADEPCRPLLPDVQQERLMRQARGAVAVPFAVQAANGAVLDQTVWQHHFRTREEDNGATAELHAMGMNLLDRLARRSRDAGGAAVLRLHLQRSQARPGPGEGELAATRDQDDQKRLTAIRRYLAGAWPDVAYTVVVHDPAAVGMPGIEAGGALITHFGTAIGYVPEKFRAAQTSSKLEAQGQGPIGGTIEPRPVSYTGTGASGALGATGGGSPP